MNADKQTVLLEEARGRKTIPWQLSAPAAAVIAACAVAFMGIGLINPILPRIAQQLGASPSEVSLMLTSYNLIMAFSMLFTGILARRFGYKLTLILGVAIIVSVSLASGFTDHIWVLVALRGVWGFGNACFIATALALIVSYCEGGVDKAVIQYEAAVGIGISIGPLLGGILGTVSWQLPFFAIASMMTVTMAALALFLKNPDREEYAETGGPALSRMWKIPLEALKERKLRIWGVSAALYNIGFFTIMAYVPFVLRMTTRSLGFVFLGWGVMLAVSSVFVAPWLKERLGTLRSVYFMLLALTADLAFIGLFADNRQAVAATAIASGFILGITNTLITSAAMDATALDRATASSGYSFLRFIGAAIAPFMASKLGEIFQPQVPFFAAALFVLCAFWYLWRNDAAVRGDGR
ncbi:MFS transporter [Sporosarcina sp. P1]|uniref:MFS transporter n=1 Tax=Sporosarcina sp. P1 TaxID=2048257 RepID=UPI000C16A16F|nr:MFS transporter [Sporosarcina sp. P1]PIC82994.1 MFS transporter [Sporosarcina sp. P1]